MVAPLSQASNNSTGMSGYTSSCGAGASTSAYVGTQQLAVLPGCSSSGLGEIQRSTGSVTAGGSVTYTLGADVDIHSEIHYTYELSVIALANGGASTAGKYKPFAGLGILKDVTIKVGTSEWETIQQPAMLAMAQLEMGAEEYGLWAEGLHGHANEPTGASSFSATGVIGGGKLMCCVKGGYRGQLFVAAMPYQSITVKINFNEIESFAVPSDSAAPYLPALSKFTLYTKQHILSPYERGLMQSTDILQLLGTTHYFSHKIVSNTTTIPAIDLSFLNDYCTHIAVWMTRTGAADSSSSIIGGGTGDGLTNETVHRFATLDFVYNGTSAQGEQSATLLKYSDMMGLDGGGRAPHSAAGGTVTSGAAVVVQNPHICLFQLANTPCVSSLSKSESQFAPFAGGDGVANNRYDVIQFKATLNAASAGYYINFVAFGAQSVLYSAGGAVKN